MRIAVRARPGTLSLKNAWTSCSPAGSRTALRQVLVQPSPCFAARGWLVTLEHTLNIFRPARTTRPCRGTRCHAVRNRESQGASRGPDRHAWTWGPKGEELHRKDAFLRGP